tara:strand:- start:2595 stop:3509 length:915 start_codon:yes stop_codon:yes gene_type:complete
MNKRRGKLINYDRILSKHLECNYDCFVIDDTVHPGIEDNLDIIKNRETHVGIFIEKRNILELWKTITEKLKIINNLYGVEEFHFTNILNGRREYKDVDYDKRIEIFKFFVNIFFKFNIFGIVQSFIQKEKDFMLRRSVNGEAEAFMKKGEDIKKKVQLDIRRTKEMSLFFLILKFITFYKKNYNYSSCQFFVDQGIVDKNRSTDLYSSNINIYKNSINFIESKKFIPAQLADFVAFSLGRTQLIYSRKKRTHRDLIFLETLGPMLTNIDGLTQGELVTHENFFDESNIVDYTDYIKNISINAKQ